MKSSLTFFLFFTLLSVFSCAGNTYQSETASVKSSDSEYRQIRRTAHISLKVDSIEEAIASIKTLTYDHQGSVIDADHYREKNADIKVKIPASELDVYLDQLSALGKVREKSERAEDITEQIIDAEARLENLKTLRARYRELVMNAKSMSEILKIEKELTKIQSEIDTLEGRRKSLLNQVAQSLVTIELRQKSIYGPLGYATIAVGWIIKKLFVIK
jgi:DNA repair ATPase RecN